MDGRYAGDERRDVKMCVYFRLGMEKGKKVVSIISRTHTFACCPSLFFPLHIESLEELGRRATGVMSEWRENNLIIDNVALCPRVSGFLFSRPEFVCDRFHLRKQKPTGNLYISGLVRNLL